MIHSPNGRKFMCTDGYVGFTVGVSYPLHDAGGNYWFIDDDGDPRYTAASMALRNHGFKELLFKQYYDKLRYAQDV